MPLEKGPYIGDVTALCLATLPSGSTAVLAGTGAQVDCYNLDTGARFFPSIHVFDGIRVHGIVAAAAESIASSPAIVAVHGEGKAKIFRWSCENLELWHSVPRFSKWILDVRFLPKDDFDLVLAIGLSDNSVCLWNTSSLTIVSHYHGPEKCLLYSMRLYGDSVATLQIAAGTIYNEVLVWTFQQCRDDTESSYEAKVLHRLCGHEGSIYRIAWSDDGCFLGSVSDDRSARIWNLGTKTVIALFGHTARVWDLHIDEKMLITASEDCTCGVWSLNGELLKTLKGHIGRGIWRCILIPHLSVLVTAGADSSIKLYPLSDNELKPSIAQETTYRIETGKSNGYLDSKSEYVRCLCFEGSSSLYIATNHGLLQHVVLLPCGNVEQDLLLQTEERSPIVCLDVFREQTESPDAEVSVACGDGQGRAMVLRINSKGQIQGQSTWRAESERQLLGVFWCRSLDPRFVFTTDPKGGVRCWYVDEECDEQRQVAYFKSSLSSRIVCTDASFEKQVLVCGDQKGNILFFDFSSDFLEMETSAVFDELDSFRGAHGISAVASVSFAADGLTIRSTGRDGCVCELSYQRGNPSGTNPTISCARVEKISAITVLESVASPSGLGRRIGVGFAAADFVLWDITNEVELRRIPCGGWKRPHSFVVGEHPETEFCFAFVKEHTIWIYRTWDDNDDLNKTLPLQALQKQSHGREIHSVLIFTDSRTGSNWLLSGAEDGRVQISRYTKQELTVYTTLEEHVGGSAVRALALSDRIYNAIGQTSRISSDLNYAILFSAGAKEVLTCWELKSDEPEHLSARWLSTNSPSSTKTSIKDDLRYLALTVLAVVSDAGTPVYFVVAAVSNAILAVKAFDLSTKTWSCLGYLQHHKAPVLTLHNVVLQDAAASKFLVFSGSTDGSIAVWDLTALITKYSVSCELQSQVNSSLRPLSGRGSQGGKARRRLHHQRHLSAQILKDSKLSPSCLQQSQAAALIPVCVLDSCHQSGVNSLYAFATSASAVSIASGGDDQSLHFCVLSLEEESVCVLSRESVANAHSSAIKGVWCDDELVFSTGLDQRVRFWRIGCDGALSEASGSCIIDVPETESINAHVSDNKKYNIAVGGRGLQVVIFEL